MTVTTIERLSSSAEAGALPEPTKVWGQFDFGDQIGFRGREAVSIAASFFERNQPVYQWQTNDANLVRVERPDGTVGFYDPSTGEIHQARPTARMHTVDTATGKGVGRSSREAGRRWIKTDPEATGPPMVVERFEAGQPTLPQPPAGYEYFGPVTEIEFFDPETGRPVDTGQTRSQLVDEKLSAPIEYSAVITPGTFGVRCHDPRDASDPPEVTDAMEWDDETEEWVVKPASIREPITEFSRKSKARMVRRILSIPWGDYIGPDEQLMVVTLTAPPNWREFLGSKDQSYKALRRFEKRMADRTDERCRMFWHVEFQRRGAPHWHCLMVLPLTVKGQPVTKVVSQQWFEAVGSEDPKHLAAGTRIDFDESIKGTDPLRVSLYFAGYSTNSTGSSKDKSYQFEVPEGWADTNGSVGRWWGKFGVKPAVEEVRIDAQAVVEAKRLFRARERAQRGRVSVEDLSPERKAAWDRKGRLPDADGSYTTPLMGLPKRRNRGTARNVDNRTPVGTLTPADFGSDETWCALPEVGPEYGPDYQPTRPSKRRRYVSSFKGPMAGATLYLNDAPAFAIAVARHLTRLTVSDNHPIGMRGTAAQRLARRRADRRK